MLWRCARHRSERGARGGICPHRPLRPSPRCVARSMLQPDLRLESVGGPHALVLDRDQTTVRAHRVVGPPAEHAAACRARSGPAGHDLSPHGFADHALGIYVHRCQHPGRTRGARRHSGELAGRLHTRDAYATAAADISAGGPAHRRPPNPADATTAGCAGYADCSACPDGSTHQCRRAADGRQPGGGRRRATDRDWRDASARSLHSADQWG